MIKYFLWHILTVHYDCTDEDGEERSLTGTGLDLVPELEENKTTETLSEDEHQSENTALWGGRSPVVTQPMESYVRNRILAYLVYFKF